MNLFYLFLMILVTLIWGFAFVALRWALEELDPYSVHFWRFFIASMGAIPYLLYKKSFFKKSILKKSFVASTFLTGVLLFQTIGLQTTTVAKSAFITTLYTLFIPLILILFFKKSFHFLFWALVFLGLWGMSLLCQFKFDQFNKGDFFSLICAVFSALQIIYIDKISKNVESAVEFNFLQSIFVALWGFIFAFSFGHGIKLNSELNSKTLLALLFLGLISSLFAFTLQVIAQKKIPSHISGLVFLIESPFAAFSAYLVLDEVLQSMQLTGAALIILSVALVPILGREVVKTEKRSL